MTQGKIGGESPDLVDGRVDLTAIDDYMTHSLERHAIDLGEWVAFTSNQRARERGHDTLRPVHNRVFVHLALTGSRVVDIAKAQGISKNAVGQVISELEELGYVERRPDPSDGRAKSVHYTDKGLQMLADAREIGEEIDADIIATIGARKYALLSQLLAEAVEVRNLLGRPQPA